MDTAFVLDTIEALVPGQPPPGFPARQSPTTQIQIRRTDWPGNVFRLWLPENVGELWRNTNPALAHQAFHGTERQGLLWRWEQAQVASIEAELTPRAGALLLVVRITNCGRLGLSNVDVMNCLHLSAAPDFACDDFSRIYIRSQGRWQSLVALKPTCADPYYYRAGHLREGGRGWLNGKLDYANQPAEADHPLMVCLSRDGRRSIGTASERYLFLFHNQGNEHLLCIHSQQEPVPWLESGQTAVFRQEVYLVDGGLSECVAAFEQSVQTGFGAQSSLGAR